MRLSWDGIVFDIVLLEDWLREAVYDPSGSDFLHWHHVIDVIVTVGGDATNRRRFPEMKKEVAGGRIVIPDRGNQLFDRRGKPFPMISPNGARLFKDNGLARGAGDLEKSFSGKRDLDFPRANNDLPWTDSDLRRRLQLPRRQLLIWTYSSALGLKNAIFARPNFLLVSPLTGVDVDCKNGPICTVMALPKISGNVSGLFRLRFETWEIPFNDSFKSAQGDDGQMVVILENAKNADHAKDMLANQTPLISNRWKMRQEPDPETYLNTTVIEGTAIFRMDVLKVKKYTADQLRKHFMHPIPFGYVRMPPVVELSPIGDAVSYTITDHQVMTNFLAGHRHGLIHIEISESVELNSPNEGQWR